MKIHFNVSKSTILFASATLQICMEDHFEGDTGLDCLLSVDGTDFHIAKATRSHTTDSTF